MFVMTRMRHSPCRSTLASQCRLIPVGQPFTGLLGPADMAFRSVCMAIRVVAVDTGSAGPSSKFGWAAVDAPKRQAMAGGTDPETAVSVLAPGLLPGARAAVLLQAPMSVPGPGRPARCVAHGCSTPKWIRFARPPGGLALRH
jgi:hypothetical protein